MAGERDGRSDAAAGVGATLRAAREARGASLQDCAAALRARSDQLRALEAGELAVFGGEVYARGFVRSYARLLEVEPGPLLAELGGAAVDGVQHLRELPTERRPVDRRTPAWAVAAALVVVGGAVLAGVLRLGAARTPDAAPPPSVPRPATEEPAAPAPSAPVAPAPTPAPAAVAPVVLVLTLEAPSWLEVVVDGAAVEPGRTAPAGETLRFEGQGVVVVRYGNAGGVRAELNGVDLGPQGASGQVVRLGYGPEGPLATPPDAEVAG